jgi:transposase InsO family protein
LAARYGLNPKTVAKWRGRTTTADARMGPARPRSTVLTDTEEAIVVAFRRRTLLPLDDVLGCLRETIPKLSRSALHRCLQRHGISRLPHGEDKASKRKRFAEAIFGGHIFDRVCDQNAIRHRLTKPYHPWTKGQAERMNRTVKDATIKAFHYPDLEALRNHVLAFVAAYNFAKHLKALRWRTPFQAVCDAWKNDPSIFKIDPHHLIPGPHT